MYKIFFNSLFALGLAFCFQTTLFAQQTAVYRDAQEHYKRGVEFYEQALYGKAQDEFQRVLDATANLTTQPIPTWVLQAEMYRGITALRLDHADAEKELLHFVQRYEPHPLASKAYLELGRYYYNEGKYDVAAQYLSKVPLQGLSNKEIQEIKFKQGYALFVENKFDKAAAYFQQTRSDQKSDYYAQSNYYFGICMFLDNKYGEALNSFKIVAKTNRYGSIVPVYICQIMFMQKNYKGVIEDGEVFMKDTKIREREQIAQLVGQSYFETGDYTKALPALEEYVSKSPKVSKESMYQLAYTQYKNKKYQEAIAGFEQLNSLDSELGQNALYNLADCHLKTNNKQAARSAFQRASQMKYNAATQEDALINYAKLSYELGFDTDAIGALQKIALTSSYYNESQNLLSNIFLNTRDYNKALEILRNMPNKNAKLKETYQKVAYYRAVQLYNDKKFDDAIKLCDESLEINAHYETTALSHFWRAEASYQLERLDESIESYKAYLSVSGVAKQLPANSTAGVAHYGLGYNYIKKGDYPDAATAFGNAVSELEKMFKQNKANDDYLKIIYPDALLRAGDCYLYQNKYDKAGGYYDRIIESKYSNQDYAVYQKSLILGIKRDYGGQVALLDRLINNYPQSTYIDDALFAKGVTQMNNKQFDLAHNAFHTLVYEHDGSEFTNRALLKMGIIARSQNRKEEAKNYYKTAIRNNPQSEEAQDAYAGLEEICLEEGNPDECIVFWESISGQKISDMAKDTLLYKAAEKRFLANDWAASIDAFTKYLNQFPSGINHVKAHYYRAEANFELKQYDAAYGDYSKLSDENNPAFAKEAHYQAARIAYHIKQDHVAAYKFFGRLEPLVQDDEQKRFEALQFKMRSGFFAKQYPDVPSMVERFLKETRATNADKGEAYYYAGKSFFELKNYRTAETNLQQNISLSEENAMSAEARYLLAYIKYLERDLDNALEMSFKTGKEIPNQTYWLVKVYILIADIYTEKSNLFQAKATLQSIVDNYEGDQALLNEAKAKLENVKKLESGKSKIQDGGNKKIEIIND